MHALRGVSLTVERGDYVAIMGASGSGKSTLMNILGCLDVATSGRYLLDGVDVRDLDEDALALVRNRRIGFVFQAFNLIPRTTALRNVELPLAYAGVKAVGAARAGRGRAGPGRPRRPGLARAEPALRRPAAAGRGRPRAGHRAGAAAGRRADRQPRLALHRGRARRASRGSTPRGRTIVLITHEPDVAAHARRLIRLGDGQIVEDQRNRPLRGVGRMTRLRGAALRAARGHRQQAALRR